MAGYANYFHDKFSANPRKSTQIGYSKHNVNGIMLQCGQTNACCNVLNLSPGSEM